MNFIEVGLPHTEFVPTKKEFSPRRPIPMSGLSKRYMGLETLSKSELGSLIDRLSQPKTTPTGQESVEDTNTEAKDGPKKRKSGRFLGSKKMKKSDLDNMIARLAGSSQNKTPDSRRIQGTEERIKRGVTASYAWQGKSVLQRNLTLPVANHHAQYKTLLNRHSFADWHEDRLQRFT